MGTPPPTLTLGHLGATQHTLTLLGPGMLGTGMAQDILGMGMGMLGIPILGVGILAMDTTQQILGIHIILDR